MEFDSSRLSCEELLDCFFRMHDPTTLNRQHNDVGMNRPIVTGTAAAGKLHPAADYHQEYLVKHPGGCTCYVLREM